MRYWKGAYDEDSAREIELRRSSGPVTDRLETESLESESLETKSLESESIVSDDDKRALGIFHALVAVQVLMAAVAALLSLAELLGSSR